MRMRAGDDLAARLLYRLHHANPAVAQVELEAAIGSSHYLTTGSHFFVHA